MLICWLFPELNLIESKRERKRVFQDAVKPFTSSSGYWIVLIVGMVGSQRLSRFMAAFVAAKVGMAKMPWWFDIPLMFALCILVGLLPYWLMRRRITKDIRRYLNQNGFKLCIGCGYDLRGQVEPRCPECGSTIKSQTGTA